MQTILFCCLLFVFVWSAMGYLLSRISRRNDWADILWGPGFVALAGAAWMALGGTLTPRSGLALALVTLWGVRLAIHLGNRNLQKSEDFRYAQWRKDWGKTEPWRAYLQVFLLQSIILLILALPWLAHLLHAQTPWGPLGWLGSSIFLGGLGLEWVADAQLHAHRKLPAPRPVLNSGLWAYVRHPNYLGEILMTWGLFISVLELPGSPWVLAVSPLLLTFLLVRISGVPMLDSALAKRSAAHARYIESTPALWPFQLKHLLQFSVTLIVLLGLDSLWLGTWMKGFYVQELQAVARKTLQGDWDPWWPAVPGVYLALALGIHVFALHPSRLRTEAMARAALFGFCVYAVYEMTNQALVANWPATVVAVDLAWGTVLCGVTAALVFRSPKSIREA